VETEESENWNGKLKRKTEAESGNGKAEIRKWSSTFLALRAIVCACVIRLGLKKYPCQGLLLVYQLNKRFLDRPRPKD
jgi:hypothetical protein